MDATEEKSQEHRDFRNVSIRFSVRFNYVLFPVDTVELVSVLMKSGYAPTAPPPSQIPPRGVRLTIAGVIARKGEVLIDINDERGILGATAPSAVAAIDGLNEVLQLVKTNFNIDLEKSASFHEHIGHAEVETDKNPFEKIGNVIRGKKITREFGRILGDDVSLFTLRLSPTGKIPNQTEWFDITIEPDILKASTYNVSTIFRSHDKSRVQKFTEDFILNISRLIGVVETA